MPTLIREAHAEVDNNGLSCTATVAGVDVRSISSSDTSQAIQVGENDNVVVTTTASKPIRHYDVDMDFGPFTWTVASGGGTNNSWQNIVKVSDYDRYGAGLYKVGATSRDANGNSCTMFALINVTKSPIPGTVAGDAAGALAVLSALGIGGSALRSSSGGSDSGGTDGGGDSGSGGSSGGSGGGGVSGLGDVNRFFHPPKESMCFWLILPALLMTIGFMVVPSGGGGASVGPARRLPRARWRPRLSFVSIVSGVVGAVSVLVLLQQYGRVFPTLNVTITGLVVGLVVGIALPSLFRAIAVVRWNRRMATRERAMAARAEA